MKKVLITLFVAVQTFAILAQKSEIDKEANAACDCIKETELNDDMTSMDAELMLGQCMAPSIMENMEVYVEYVNLDMFDGISRSYVPVKLLISILGNE